MTKPNLIKEAKYLQLVAEGRLSVLIDGTVINTKTNNKLGSNPAKDGYHYISMNIDGKYLAQSVHRLVFLVHGGILDEEFPIVNHKDGNKSNNKFSNLEKSNEKHNHDHSFALKLNIPINLRNIKTVLSQEIAEEIRSIYNTGKFTQKELGKKFGVGRRSISKIVNFKAYK